MRVANIVPPQWEGRFPTGGYRMTLAPWVLKYNDYRVKASFLILDNGAFEGNQVSNEELFQAAAYAGATEVVLPDVRGDPGETLRTSWAATSTWCYEVSRLMFVPQARTEADWDSCLKAWVKKWEEHNGSATHGLTIGVTCLRETTGTNAVVGSRLALALIAQQYDFPIHLLGAASTEQLVEEVKLEGIRGIDTSLAFALGAERTMLVPGAEKVFLKEPGDYSILDEQQMALIRLNTYILQYWFDVKRVTKYIPIELLRIAAGPNAPRSTFEYPVKALQKTGCRGEWAMCTKNALPVALWPLKWDNGGPRITIIKEI